MNISDFDEKQMWEYVASHLSSKGIETVLVGGGAVAVYTKGMYRSGDLDLIITRGLFENKDKYMNEIGFVREGKNFKHPDSPLFIEFPSGPLGIGEDYQITPQEFEANGQIIKILSPTDSVKDRLASYIYFKDITRFEQALEICRRYNVNLSKVEKWCKKERGGDKIFKQLIKELNVSQN